MLPLLSLTSWITKEVSAVKTYYQTPEAELIDFTANERLAIVEKDEDLGDDPNVDFISKDF